MEARALGFLPFAPCTGEGPGLGLEGGLSDIFLGGGLCLLASEEGKKEEKKKRTRGSLLYSLFFFFLKEKERGWPP
jgi:hypothetical protein